MAEPMDPALSDWVLPLVLALPDLAPEPEFDVVLTATDGPPLPELPGVATGLEVALPVLVDPVEVLPEAAAALPLQLAVTPTQDSTVTAGSELPKLPEFSGCADGVEVADPVFPELAFPELALVLLELVELASPELPPAVVPLAVELPLWPEVPLAVELSLASPESPEVPAPLVLPELPVPLLESDCRSPHWLPDRPSEPALADPLLGSDVAEPLFPRPSSETSPALAGPVDPVLPDRVLPLAVVFLDLAMESKLDVKLTGPDHLTLPEPPRMATGLGVGLPVLVEPVEPVEPDEDSAI